MGQRESFTSGIHASEQRNRDDEILLKRIGKKEMAAMETFYRRYENLLFRFALKKLNHEIEAAEIVNTVMLEVWNNASFEGRSKVSTWLMGIANFRIIDLLRKRKKNHVDIEEIKHKADENNEIDMHKVVAAAQTRDFIEYCLHKLSTQHKQVMELLFFQESSYEEIAESMTCSIGTVKSRIFHAKKQLKQCLVKYLD